MKQTYRVDGVLRDPFGGVYADGHTLINAESADEALAIAIAQDEADDFPVDREGVTPRLAVEDDLWLGAESWDGEDFCEVVIAE